MNQPPIDPPPIKYSKPIPWAILIIVMILLVAAGIYGWYYFSHHQAQAAPTTITNTAPSNTAPPAETASDCEKYINSKYGFEIEYPKNYTYEEKTPKGNLTQIIFVNSTLGSENQLFITVNDKKGEISVPEGVDAALVKDVTIGGVVGKDFGDVSYIVDSGQYRYELSVNKDANATLKIMLKVLVQSFKFSA